MRMLRTAASYVGGCSFNICKEKIAKMQLTKQEIVKTTRESDKGAFDTKQYRREKMAPFQYELAQVLPFVSAY